LWYFASEPQQFIRGTPVGSNIIQPVFWDISQQEKSNNRPAPPIKLKNKDRRSREYLTQDEVAAIIKAAKIGRHGHRDSTLILMMFRHGLRVSEAINLKWDQVNLNEASLHINRLKNGKPCCHPIEGDELRALRKLQRDYEITPYLFVSQQKTTLSRRTVHRIVATAGQEANLPLSIHPHMLRHATGYYLANKGVDTRTIQAYLGHSDIANTVIYTELAPMRFKNLWS
jgi:site-specific recombinase XerD